MITEYCEDYEKSILLQLRMNYNQLNLLEFGCNLHWRGGSSKIVYESMGVNHTSIDINGKLGSLVIDLDKPIPDDFIQSFDVVSNYGILEHVNLQYMGFKNMHDATRNGGIMMHGFPLVNHWPGHCRYRYTKEFVQSLAALANYEIIDLHVASEGIYAGGQNLIFTTLRKKNSDPFLARNEFSSLEIDDCGDLSMTGNYDA